MTPKKILFANVPADGHFNPLTPLAKHLLKQGHDVRWYTGAAYRTKVEQLGIRFYPCIKALDLSSGTPETLFPERSLIKNKLARFKFDIRHVFVLRTTEYLEDIKDIRKNFDFDLVIADITFTALPFIKHTMKKPVVSIGIVPLTETSVDLPPNGLGLTPSYSTLGKLRQHCMRWFVDKVIFKESKNLIDSLYHKFNMQPPKQNVFSMLCRESDLLLQSGTPGFEYYRSDLGKNICFIGPLLPANTGKKQPLHFADRLSKYKHVVLVTQGTVESDINKLLVPSIEALKDNKEILTVVTTGGSGTEALRKKYAADNLVIEDFIPYDTIMPYANAYITNGGYGGVMFSIQHGLPMVAAGIHEGKNEICARIGYFKLGINLNTETPTSQQLYKAVMQVLSQREYRFNVENLKAEFSRYDSLSLLDKYLEELMPAPVKKQPLKVLSLERELVF